MTAPPLAIKIMSEATTHPIFGYKNIIEVWAQRSVAVGTELRVGVSDAAAIGSYSTAGRAGFTALTIAPYSNVDLNGKTIGAVSVGTTDKLRQIIYVAGGTEDTDVANLRQLKGLDNIAVR